MDKKPTSSLIIIAILTIIFFSLVILSYGNTNVDINYDFVDELIVDEYPNSNNRLTIGEINIQNNAILPKKIRLKKFVACQLSYVFGDNTYNLNYAGSSKEYNKEFLFNGMSSEYIEISSKESVSLEIYPEIYDYKNNIDRYDLTGKALPFYIFEIPEDMKYYYNYCRGKNIEDAFKTVHITFNTKSDSGRFAEAIEKSMKN